MIDVYGASINAALKAGNKVLHQAALAGNVEVVKTLLSYDHCDVNVEGQWGRTALHAACQNGHVACIHELMTGGAQVNVNDCYKITPLHVAAAHNHPNVVTTLVDVYKASINAANMHGCTALHDAAHQGSTEVARVLVSNPQCDVTIRTSDGKTAEDIARDEGHFDDIVRLINAANCPSSDVELIYCRDEYVERLGRLCDLQYTKASTDKS